MSDLDRMIPDLQASFACEDVRLEASGIAFHRRHHQFHRRAVAADPGDQALRLTRWSSGVGQFEQTTRLVGPDEETVLAAATTQFHLTHEESHTTNVNIFGGIQFTHVGAHHVEILLDTEMRLRFPIRVMLPSAPQP